MSYHRNLTKRDMLLRRRMSFKMSPPSWCLWWGGVTLCELATQPMPRILLYCGLSPCCICVFTCTLGLMNLAVQCVVCASCQGPRGSLKVSGTEWTTPAGRLCACCCVTVGEYHDIKQYHSGLCALTQGTLCTFLQGWGDRGEAVEGGLGRVDTVWWLLACHGCFTTVVSLGKSYGKHNGKAITWKQ